MQIDRQRWGGCVQELIHSNINMNTSFRIHKLINILNSFKNADTVKMKRTARPFTY